MPRRNRVDPLGNIVAHPARGTLMGNRGCLHDAAGEIVRASNATAWISCLPVWPQIRRQLMKPGAYTELFFLDEPTALAAGHRPCGQCRPAALQAFKAAWARARNLTYLPHAAEIDAVLRTEARQSRHAAARSLPNGTMILVAGQPWLVWRGERLRWSFDGYSDAEPLGVGQRAPITSPSMIGALNAGYLTGENEAASTYSPGANLTLPRFGGAA